MFDEAIPNWEAFYNTVTCITSNGEAILEEKKLLIKNRKQIKNFNFTILE
tara:strand:- start:54 stop:203 length:150 start_codon:yes stop_codon:yes gene_type:complete